MIKCTKPRKDRAHHLEKIKRDIEENLNQALNAMYGLQGLMQDITLETPDSVPDNYYTVDIRDMLETLERAKSSVEKSLSLHTVSAETHGTRKDYAWQRVDDVIRKLKWHVPVICKDAEGNVFQATYGFSPHYPDHWCSGCESVHPTHVLYPV